MSRNGDNGAEQEEEERGYNRAHTQPCKWARTEGACEAANEEKGKSFKDSPQHVPFCKEPGQVLPMLIHGCAGFRNGLIDRQVHGLVHGLIGWINTLPSMCGKK